MKSSNPAAATNVNTTPQALLGEGQRPAAAESKATTKCNSDLPSEGPLSTPLKQTSHVESHVTVSSSDKSGVSISSQGSSDTGRRRNPNESNTVQDFTPEVVTDVSTLNLPGLHHSIQSLDKQEESRNDHENNSTGTGSTMQSTANPCFIKQDSSRHLLPSHTVSLTAQPAELPGKQQINSDAQWNHHQRQSSQSSLRTSSFVSGAIGSPPVDNGLTLESMSISSIRHDLPPELLVPTNASMAERAEQIIMEARRQTSRSNAVNKRTEEILREARLASSARMMMRQGGMTAGGGGGSNKSFQSASILSGPKEVQESFRNDDSKSTQGCESESSSSVRRNSNMESDVTNVVASRQVDHEPKPAQAMLMTQQCPVSSTRSPTVTSIVRSQLSEHPPTNAIEAMASMSIDEDEKDDGSSQLFRTRSAEEVLEIAASLLHEARAQLEDVNDIDEPVPKLLSTPPRRLPQEEPVEQPASGATTILDFQLLSPSESDIASLDDYDKAVDKLPSRFNEEGGPSMTREKILQKLDGMPLKPEDNLASSSQDVHRNSTFNVKTNFTIPSAVPNNFSSVMGTSVGSMKQAPVKPVVIKSMEVKQQPEDVSTIGSWFNYLMGTASKDTESDDQNSLDAFGVSCGSPRADLFHRLHTVGALPAGMMDSHLLPPSFPELAVASRKSDERLQEWVENQFKQETRSPEDGSYHLGESKSIVVHEILRGNWTWCTAWSPDGNRLAIATENHHLAVVETTNSTVWRVKHDRRTKGPAKKGTTQSIRSIAWGDSYIAIGGTGNAVSILAPNDPYPILHTITPTGFVGSMNWLPGTNKLLIGSRLGKAILLDIWVADDKLDGNQMTRNVQSTVLHVIDREKSWVNAVQFSTDGQRFAVGDSKGILGVYTLACASKGGADVHITNIANFKLEDSILDLEWSADDQYLYAGGEDFAVTIIATQHWEPVHRIKRDRWVQFIASSKCSSHVAVGGVTSEVSILEVNRGWENVINIGLKGLVPLSAKWHPRDQYLVLTGQNNSVIAIETTNARHISGHFLRSVYAIRCVTFSPDGRVAAVGNESGIVTLFTLSRTTFICAYELVVDFTGSLSMEWSQNGSYIAIAAGNKVVIVARTETLKGSAPPNTSGFFVAKVIKDFGEVHDVTIDPTSRFVAASGTKTRILDATSNFKVVLEMENGGTTLANSWSSDGHWFAVIGVDHSLVIYDTSPMNLSRWQSVFTVKTNQAGLALAWGPSSIEGLQYCAYGGENDHISIVEIRTVERTWETVIDIPREGAVNSLDWNEDGLLAAAVSNGTVTVLDLSYLQSGFAVNEMDYNWQRQALTCFTEVRRNKGKQSMKTVKWIPSARGSENLLAFGGTDGELEILDLTERNRCRGFQSMRKNDGDNIDEERY